MRGRETPEWQALVDARATLTLVEGLGTRFHQLVSPRGSARTWSWRLVAVLGALGDAAKSIALHRDDEFRLPLRMVADAADLALWCLAAGDDPDTSEDAVIPGASLAVEAGGRLGLAALIVPLCNASVAALVRRARGHELRLSQFSWQVMGVGSGWTVSLLARRQRKRLVAFHREELVARTQQAELTGMQDELRTHEAAIDLLQRATALIEFGAPGHSPARRDLTGSVKAAVAQAVRDRSTFLRDALMVWQSRHNFQPDLTRLVNVGMDEADGSVVLSAEQAALLHQRLDARRLRGPVEVRLADPTAAWAPFGRRDLVVNGERLALPALAGERHWNLDAVPAAFLLDLGWLAQPTGSHREQVPWLATLPSMALATAGAAWSVWRRERGRELTARQALVGSFVTTFVYLLGSSRSMRHPHTAEGVSRFPWVMALQGYELVRGLVAERLGPFEKVAASGGTAVIVGVGWLASPRPRSGRALVAELSWVVGFSAYARRLRRAMKEVSEAVAHEIASGDELAFEDAYTRGRQRLREAVEASLSQAEEQLRRSQAELAGDVQEEAARRLGRVAAMLAGVSPSDRRRIRPPVPS